jgi:ABC-type dipeptide/oligopeptide/nickel transport system ATPase component/ABC-type dipeptide/oligopeptide/nickel transport system permease subunit
MSASVRREDRILWRAVGSMPGVIALVLLTGMVIFGVLGSTVLLDAATTIDPTQGYQSSTAEHWLGTDELGRDNLARVAQATGLSLMLAVAASSIGFVGGMLLGSAVWFGHRIVGSVSGAAIGIAIAFPGLLLVIFTAMVLGRGVGAAIIAVGVGMIPFCARIVHNLVLTVREREYVLAALVQGQSRLKIFLRHILPNIAEPLIVNMAHATAATLVAFAGLSFLGLGVQSPDYDWGLLLSMGTESIYVSPLPALVPGVMIAVTGLALNLMGEAFARSFESGPPRGQLQVPSVRAVEVQSSITGSDDDLVRVDRLNIWALSASETPVHLVKDVSFTIKKGRIVGLVGESGSGKTITAQAIAALTDETLVVTAQDLSVDGVQVDGSVDVKKADWFATNVGYIFQDSSSAFNPAMRLNSQIPEVLRVHEGIGRQQARSAAVRSLDAVGVPDAQRRLDQYPHEFSGGMRQRAMIAMSTITGPKLVIADEPTTALDVQLKVRVLALLRDLRDRDGSSVLLISHDISSLLGVADDLIVMYQGRVVENGPAERIARSPQHPYTAALLGAVPRMDSPLDEPLATITQEFDPPVAAELVVEMS